MHKLNKTLTPRIKILRSLLDLFFSTSQLFVRSRISDKGDHEKEKLIVDWREGSLIKDNTKKIQVTLGFWET